MTDWQPFESAPRDGNIITIAGIYRMVLNPNRRWWTFWRPRLIESAELQTFRVIGPTAREG